MFQTFLLLTTNTALYFELTLNLVSACLSEAHKELEIKKMLLRKFLAEWKKVKKKKSNNNFTVCLKLRDFVSKLREYTFNLESHSWI